MPKMEDWMDKLNDDLKLSQLCLPGSHDAGVYRDKQNGVAPGPSTCCQDSNIWKQARDGCRVFDIRCFLRTTGVIKKKKAVTMGHFFKEGKDGYLGEYGGTLISALEDAGFFLQNHRREFLIFRVGHTKCTGDVAEALKEFRNITDPNTFKQKYATLIHRGCNGNLADLKVSALRGKLLLVFDKEFHCPSFSSDEGYYPYYKYPSNPNIGLTFCGKYKGALSTKLALKSENKGNWSADGAVKLALAGIEDHKTHTGPTHLLWTYWQETGGNVGQNTAGAGGMRERLDAFVSDIKQANIQEENPNKRVIPNVIGHDFVNEDTCRKIAKLNPNLDTIL
jgi:hypothetical protein